MSYLQFQQLHYRAFFIPINSFQLTIKLIEIRDNIFVISIKIQFPVFTQSYLIIYQIIIIVRYIILIYFHRIKYPENVVRNKISHGKLLKLKENCRFDSSNRIIPPSNRSPDSD